MMKHYRIVDEINGQVCTVEEARGERSALKKFLRSRLSSGFYSIVTESDGRARLISSFGSSFRADAV